MSTTVSGSSYVISSGQTDFGDTVLSGGTIIVQSGGSAIATVGDRGVASLDTTRPRHTVIEIIPRPGASGANGIWIEFDGARWYSDGAAVSYSPERFAPAGDYRGFSVFRDKASAAADEIWVEVVARGPLAPYRKSK